MKLANFDSTYALNNDVLLSSAQLHFVVIAMQITEYLFPS